MNKEKILGLLLSTSIIGGASGVALTYQSSKVQNNVLLVNKINNSNTLTGKQIQNLKNKTIEVGGMKFSGIQAVKIAPDMLGNEFAVAPNFNPNGFASPINEKLYNYEANLNNDAAAMKEATALHDGNPDDTCVYFQSSALRAIGQDVPYYIGYTTHLENWLANNGWTRHVDFQYLQKGDICFAGTYHTFLFMGWKDESKGIAYVMGNESFSQPYYRDRNLSGQSPAIYGDNSYYETTCYWTYGQGYTGPIEGRNPVHEGGYNAIGLTTINVMDAKMMLEPNKNSRQLQVIPNNTTVPVIAQINSWFNVYYNGKTGWINSEDTSGLVESFGRSSNNIPNTSGSNNTPNSNSNTNLPSVKITSPIGLWEGTEPSLNGEKIIAIPYDTSVSVLGYDNGWYKVNYNGITGWIDGVYTSGQGKPIGKNLNEKNSQNKINKNNHGDSSMTNPNTTASPIASNNSSNQHQSKKITTKNNKSIGNSNTNKDTKNSINSNTKKRHTTTTTKDTTSQKNKPSVKNSTSNINSTGKTSISKENNNSKIGRIRVESILGVDLDASIKHSEITNIPNNTILDVISQKDGWFKVRYNGELGWVDGQFTSQLNDINKTFTGVNIVGLTLTDKEIHSMPTAISSIIGVIPNSTVLNLVGEQDGWYKVNYDGKIGWINQENLNVI